MPDNTELDLTFIVENCVCENPELHPDMFYMELKSGTEKTMDLPQPSDAMVINLNK